ncbi:LysM domain-containing protein [Microbacterium sp. BH-3-3-3]|uniref:LysM peptidoglycan-binding domain-containing protein n=1 Tax=Microbacterium sp. BH-3-3-3 TaxID=1906742 RepID=UPI00119F49B0|nr:LysM domain-containing protein [Microbacterium sp. BH-3-3-3]
MKPSAKVIAGVVCAVVVVGLAAMTVPAFAPLGTVASVAAGLRSSLESTPSDATTPSASAPADPYGPPEGYVDVGNGTWIPGGGFGDCAESAYIHMGSQDGQDFTASLFGKLVDTGVREFAAGTPAFADDGRIATYTVAPGDVPTAIGDRFCIWNGMSLTTLNGIPGSTAIQPGQVLVLDPAAVPGFVFDYPYAR